LNFSKKVADNNNSLNYSKFERDFMDTDSMNMSYVNQRDNLPTAIFVEDIDE
jgi:hypothetical protein